MEVALDRKFKKLQEIIRSTGGCAVAFSGGVDSTLVLETAFRELHEKTLAVISVSSTYASRECDEAVSWVKSRNIPFRIIESEELDIPGFSENPPDRCYHCKYELFSLILETANQAGLSCVADGTNADDSNDYRPGSRAARELGVISPLAEAGLGKEEIRIIARDKYKLPVWNKPAMACLASRFPYGQRIDREKLAQIGSLEEFLMDSGFSIFRARHHGDTVRIELGREELPRILESPLRESCIKRAKDAGFNYVTIDLQGYRTGSMNETLSM